MATIINRRNRYYVVYDYTDINGKRKQKWETYKTMAEARKRMKEVEYKDSRGELVVNTCQTLNDLLDEFVALYGKEKWAPSTYSGNTALIKNYISPIIGGMKLEDISTHVIEKYYQRLLKTRKVSSASDKKNDEFCSPSLIREIHKLLHSCFKMAVKWDFLDRNPCQDATLPKVKHNERAIWDEETLFHALDVCDDDRLKLCINLAFACSLRLGELLGLTWDCVDISEESIAYGNAYIFVNKELQRVERSALEELDNKDVLFTFPSSNSRTKTVLVLKMPKTETSTRKVFLPKTVAEMLIDWKSKQDEMKEMLGAEYHDYNLVITNPMGNPTEQSTITGDFQKLIEENDLPRVVFHSLRHTSITYKLKLNGGDVKAVQGDSGHAQVKMVTDVYSHILDEDRKTNAQMFEQKFYSGHTDQKEQEESKKSKDTRKEEAPSNDIQSDSLELQKNAEMLTKLLSDPDTAELLKSLTKLIS